jgi:RNA polymerase sigma-70 factor (ECF subfamily)
MSDADEAPSADELLLAAARKGDATAQRRIFVAHRDRVASQVLRMTGDAGSVDDLVQEVFISAFGALDRFRGESKLNTWLYRIACNKVHNWWDSGRRRRQRELRSISRSQESPETPDESLEAIEHRKVLYRSLGALAPKLREAFVARVIEGMSLQEASESLGVPVSTVSYRTRRAELLLCEMLGIEGNSP